MPSSKMNNRRKKQLKRKAGRFFRGGIVCLGFILTAALVIWALAAIVGLGKVKTVKPLQCESVSDSTIDLTWKPVSRCDGYHIYRQNGETSELIDSVAGAETGVYKVKELEQAEKYTFYITAFKVKGDETKESKDYSPVTVTTLPSPVDVTAIYSPDKGQLSLEWIENPKASGYYICYKNSASTDIKDTQKKEIKSGTDEYTVDGLNPKEKLLVSMSAFIKADDGKIIESVASDAQEIEIAEAYNPSSFIDPSKPMIALTFDDGPGYNKASDKILDVLEKYNAKATFFMLGKNALDHKSNLAKKVELGCELGNHTYDHKHLGKNVTASDIKKCSDAIFEVTGKYPTCFRSPGGNTTEVIRNECQSENMPLYYWSVDTQDWKYRDADHVYNAVMEHAEDGDIVLMHDIYDSTAQAVARIVPSLIDKGYQLVTVSDLVYYKSGQKAIAGQQYLDGETIKNQTS